MNYSPYPGYEKEEPEATEESIMIKCTFCPDEPNMIDPDESGKIMGMPACNECINADKEYNETLKNK